MTGTKWRALAALAILAVCASTAWALINPDFTLKDLTEQADVVLLIEFKTVDDEGTAVAAVKEVLKGEFDKRKVTIEMLAMPEAFHAQGKEAMKIIEAGQKQAVLFIGFFEAEGIDDSGGDDQAKGFLHLSGQWNAQHQWYVLERYEDVWDVTRHSSYLLGTFAGSTDMTQRAVKAFRANEDLDMPVTCGVEWDREISVGRLQGQFRDARAIDLAGTNETGKADLFLASDSGDRIFRFNDDVFEDVTADLGLSTKSKASAWADFNGDGKLDLASWDGNALTICFQTADGTFESKACETGGAMTDGCRSLTTLGVGPQGRPALLASTRGGPVLMVVNPDGNVEGKPLVADSPAEDLGEAGRCVAADLDNDGLTDVLQLFAKGSLLYRGEASGEFGAPTETHIFGGKGRRAVCLGDYDADGLLDVFISSEEKNRLWHNFGGGNFVDMLNVSGEISYHAQGGGCSVNTGDFNNDGRQDIFMAFGTQMVPQLYFNRGFRSFGEAYEVNLSHGDSRDRLPQVGEGQQTGCLGDFNGDGALDMLLVLANGECWLFPRKVEEDVALTVVAGVSTGGHAGPVTVTGWRDEWPLGAFAVRPGDPGAFFGMTEPGPITLRWRLPGGQLQEDEVIAEDGPVRVMLDAK